MVILSKKTEKVPPRWGILDKKIIYFITREIIEFLIK